MEAIENLGAMLLNIIVQVMAWIFENASLVAIIVGAVLLISVTVEVRNSRKGKK